MGPNRLAEGGLAMACLARSARSALKRTSRGESSLRACAWMGAREGELGERLGEFVESKLSSGGGVGGQVWGLAGTERERNLGMGRAEGAGEAWNVGPA